MLSTIMLGGTLLNLIPIKARKILSFTPDEIAAMYNLTGTKYSIKIKKRIIAIIITNDKPVTASILTPNILFFFVGNIGL